MGAHAWSGGRFDTARWLPALLVVAGLIAYLDGFGGAFVLDDHRSIENNARLRQLWPPGPLLSGRRPVTDFSFALNYALGELEVGGYHAANLIIHMLAGLTLYGIVRRTLLRRPFVDRFGRSGPWAALVIALLWLVHPLQTQSVTYLVQRSESLMGLFYLLTLYCVIRAVASEEDSLRSKRTGGTRCPPARRFLWYAAAVASCALGMGSKAVMVSAPVVVLLYDRVFLSRSGVEPFRRRGLLYAALAGTWVVLILTDVAPRVLFPAAHVHGTIGRAFKGITPAEYALTQWGVLVRYLRLSLWPGPLCLDYGWPVARAAAAIVPPAILITTLVALAAWALFRRPWLGFLGMWFFLILAPTSSIVQIKDPLFEHRMYLPLAAVVALLVIAAWTAWTALADRLGLGDAGRRRLSVAVAALAVMSLSLGTARRNRAYASELVMWRDVVSKRPANPRARFNLGMAFFNRNDLGKAMTRFREALRIDPRFVQARYNLGKALSRQGRIAEAAAQYAEALRVDPNLARAHSDLGNILVRMGHVEEAIAHYREAIRAKPRYVRPYFNLGNVLLAQGEIAGAVDILRRAARLDARTAEIHYVLGNALRQQGRHDEAEAEYRKTLELKRDHVGARQALDTMRRNGRLP